MKILKRGNLPEQQIFKGSCYNCKTEFECLKHEGEYKSGDQRDGAFLTVNCPVCGKRAFAYPTTKYDNPAVDNSRYGNWYAQ